MDAKLKAEWVKALRSGEYRQGDGWLEHSGKNCCLGVLLKIKGVDVSDWTPSQRMVSVLPRAYRSGLDKGTMLALAKRNDGICGEHKHTFPEIADYIEQNL